MIISGRSLIQAFSDHAASECGYVWIHVSARATINNCFGCRVPDAARGARLRPKASRRATPLRIFEFQRWGMGPDAHGCGLRRGMLWDGCTRAGMLARRPVLGEARRWTLVLDGSLSGFWLWCPRVRPPPSLNFCAQLSLQRLAFLWRRDVFLQSFWRPGRHGAC